MYETEGAGKGSGPAGAGARLVEEVRFEGPERDQGVKCVDIQGKKVPGRGHSKCKHSGRVMAGTFKGVLCATGRRG